MKVSDIPGDILKRFREGCVIPALPLALSADGAFDPRSERAILRYYSDAGAGGVAVGVHSTQFAIRDVPGFLGELLRFASETLDRWPRPDGSSLMKIAGICGDTGQALEEAALAVEAGYHAGLLSLTAFRDLGYPEMLRHARAVAETVPVIGFYLQPAVGGRVLPYEFWKDFASIDNVLGVKIAPFSRYGTLDVVRGVVDSPRAGEVTLYTGNDDTIVADLITPFRIVDAGGVPRTVRIAGGLLGHWGVWTASAVKLLGRLKDLVSRGADIPPDVLSLARAITDMNAAVFDAANGFSGCIPGIHEILHRQGLTDSPRCLDPEETLSPGQSEELDRVCAAYPDLVDDDFVRKSLLRWRT